MAAKLKADKRLVRKEISKVLRSLSQADINTQSEQVIARLLKAPYFQRSRHVSCYLSMPTAELDTSSLVSEIIRLGKNLFVPKLDPATQGRMDFLRVHGEDDLTSFPAGLWGIREPSYQWQGQKRESALDKGSEGLDLILLPGVAFDRSLSRLGHGKGYYDRFISTYISTHGRQPLLGEYFPAIVWRTFDLTCGRTTPYAVGLALRQQILEEGKVPVGESDWAMDAVIGPDGVTQRDGDTRLA